jgi:hypothetical protein
MIQLENIVQPVYNRIANNVSVNRGFNILFGVVAIAKNTSTYNWPTEKKFLDPRTTARFNELVEEEDHWLKSAVAKTRNQPPWTDWEIGAEEYELRAAKLFKAYKIVEGMEADNENEWKDPFGTEAGEEKDPEMAKKAALLALRMSYSEIVSLMKKLREEALDREKVNEAKDL